MPFAVDKDDGQDDQGNRGDDVAESLVRGMSVGDVYGRWASGDGDGDEAVVSLCELGDGSLVKGHAPVGIVAEIEDEGLWSGGVECEVSGRVAGLCVERGCIVGILREPVGWVVVGEGVVVGGGGGVLVGGVGALVGVEEG